LKKENKIIKYKRETTREKHTDDRVSAAPAAGVVSAQQMMIRI
jgi:hypothetical protein